MSQKIPFTWRVMPFISFVVVLSLIIVGIILFSYVLIIVAAIMLVAWLVGFIRIKFFRKKADYQTHREEIGRVFDQDEFK